MATKKISPHQTGFQEVLATAQLLGNYPEKIVLIGVEPELIDNFGGPVTDTLFPRIEEAVQLSKEILEKWGFSLEEQNNVSSDPDETLVQMMIGKAS